MMLLIAAEAVMHEVLKPVTMVTKQKAIVEAQDEKLAAHDAEIVALRAKVEQRKRWRRKSNESLNRGRRFAGASVVAGVSQLLDARGRAERQNTLLRCSRPARLCSMQPLSCPSK